MRGYVVSCLPGLGGLQLARPFLRLPAELPVLGALLIALGVSILVHALRRPRTA